jgi:hypothetical protein
VAETSRKSNNKDNNRGENDRRRTYGVIKPCSPRSRITAPDVPWIAEVRCACLLICVRMEGISDISIRKLNRSAIKQNAAVGALC